MPLRHTRQELWSVFRPSFVPLLTGHLQQGSSKVVVLMLQLLSYSKWHDQPNVIMAESREETQEKAGCAYYCDHHAIWSKHCNTELLSPTTTWEWVKTSLTEIKHSPFPAFFTLRFFFLPQVSEKHSSCLRLLHSETQGAVTEYAVTTYAKAARKCLY